MKHLIQDILLRSSFFGTRRCLALGQIVGVLDVRLLFTAAVFLLLPLTSRAQVSLTALRPGQWLAWTNLPDWMFQSPRPWSGPGYRVDWSSFPNGPWHLLTNTSQNFVPLTNSPSPPMTACFYRVVWTNGQAWNYEAYDGQSLIVTGKLYFNLSAYSSSFVISGGSWTLASTGASTWSHHPVGSGILLPVCDDPEFDCFYTLDLHPDFVDDNLRFGSPDPQANGWIGTWFWTGFIGTEQGTFILRKVFDGT